MAGLDASAISSRGAAADVSEVYSVERLGQLQAEGRPVFVNMTADWCATCKVNERLVLSTDAFRAALKGHGATARLVLLPHESHGYAAAKCVTPHSGPLWNRCARTRNRSSSGDNRSSGVEACAGVVMGVGMVLDDLV